MPCRISNIKIRFCSLHSAIWRRLPFWSNVLLRSFGQRNKTIQTLARTPGLYWLLAQPADWDEHRFTDDYRSLWSAAVSISTLNTGHTRQVQAMSSEPAELKAGKNAIQLGPERIVRRNSFHSPNLESRSTFSQLDRFIFHLLHWRSFPSAFSSSAFICFHRSPLHGLPHHLFEVRTCKVCKQSALWSPIEILHKLFVNSAVCQEAFGLMPQEMVSRGCFKLLAFYWRSIGAFTRIS